MRHTKPLILTALATMLTLAFISSATTPNEPDPVLESFEREFNHEPSPVPRARRDDILEDELYGALNSIHWTRSRNENSDAEESGVEPKDAAEAR